MSPCLATPRYDANPTTDQPPRPGAHKLREGVGSQRWRRQRSHGIVAHVRCAPLAETVVSRLDFSKDTPHVSTHPYTTFDHSSPAGAPGAGDVNGGFDGWGGWRAARSYRGTVSGLSWLWEHGLLRRGRMRWQAARVPLTWAPRPARRRRSPPWPPAKPSRFGRCAGGVRREIGVGRRILVHPHPSDTSSECGIKMWKYFI